jgi:hypothetical protein
VDTESTTVKRSAVAVAPAGLTPRVVARRACATLMHLQGAPVVVIAAWIGHKDASLTLQLCAHSQSDALKRSWRDFESSCVTVVTPTLASRTVRTALGLLNGGADDGNRTRVFSLGS